MARIRIVESHGNLLIERLSQPMHSKQIYVIITLIVAGSALLAVSQLYHPIVYTNISNSETGMIYNNSTTTFPFTTDGSYVTNVSLTFPPGNILHYSVYEYSQYTHNGLPVTSYSFVFQHNASGPFSFNIQNRNAINGRDYVVNATAISGNRFNATMTYTIIIPNLSPTNPYIELAGILLIFSGIVLIVVRISGSKRSE